MTVYTMLIQATCERLPIADNSIDLIWTDPPYPTEYLVTYEWLAREAMRVLRPGGFVMAMAGGYNLNRIYRMFDDSGLEYFWELYHCSRGAKPVVFPRHVVAPVKPILVYSKGNSTPPAFNIIGMSEGSQRDKFWHHWGQDVESARYYIDCFSGPGQLVLDPFIGGGTTAVACELIGRRWIGCDVDPVALETTVRRLSGAMIPRQGKMLPLFE